MNLRTRLVALGMSDQEIARRLEISERAVQWRIATARRAAWVPDRIGLIAWVWEWTHLEMQAERRAA